MNIIKFGGSVINPTGEYDLKAINFFIDCVRESKEKFIFVIGGGKFCRLVQSASEGHLRKALGDDEKAIDLGRDEIGIATTKINARFVLGKFREVFGDEVHNEIILDPTQQVESAARIFFAAGWKPGESTDTDMMLLAKSFKAERVIKLSNIAVIKNVSPIALHHMSEEERDNALKQAEELHEMSWQQLVDLLGDEWVSGLNTPLDQHAAKIGLSLAGTTALYLGKVEELPKVLSGTGFSGSIVQN